MSMCTQSNKSTYCYYYPFKNLSDFKESVCKTCILREKDNDYNFIGRFMLCIGIITFVLSTWIVYY